MNIFFGASAFLLFLSIEQALSESASLKEEQDTLNAILKDYEPNIRPRGGMNETGPVLVQVNTYIRYLGDIDDVKMVYNTQLTLRQSWKDSRLKYDTKGLSHITLTQIKKIWLPDLFISNEESGHFHNIVQPNALIKIYPDGRVVYSTRISLSLFCPMDLKNYPLDNQMCTIVSASYGYTTEDVIYIWRNDEPVQISHGIQLPKFKINSFATDYCTSRTNAGEYSCIKIEMFFSRKVFHYLKSAYMPTTMLVLLSWVVFWLNPRRSTLRLCISIALLISTLIVTASINAKSPEVSCMTALDVWMVVCVLFIFFVLLELFIVDNFVLNNDSSFVNEDSTTEKNSMKMEDPGKRTHYSSAALKWLNKYSSTAQRIDVVSRFLFPAVFALFNLIYWVSYPSK